MNLYIFILWFFFMKSHIQSTNADKYYALAVVEYDREINLAWSATSAKDEKPYEFRSDDHLLEFKCPAKKPENEKLLITEWSTRKYGVAPQKICKKDIKLAVFQVEGTYKDDKGASVIIYHIGFHVKVKNSKIVRYPRYISMEKESYLIPMVSVYRSVKWNYTIAIRYEIFQRDKQTERQSIVKSDYITDPKILDNYEEFISNQKFYFTMKFSSEFYQKIAENNLSSERPLSLFPLMNEHDFAIDTWKKAVNFQANLVLVWRIFGSTWERVNKFIEFSISVKKLFDVTITAGIGNALTIDERKMEWTISNNNVIVPEFYWKAVEAKEQYHGNPVQGIFLIFDNNPFIKNEDKKHVCEPEMEKCSLYKEKAHLYLGKSLNENIQNEAKVYCCEMSDENIKTLGLEFLLKKRPILKLN